MGWVPDNIVEALRQSNMLGIYLRLDIDPPLRICVGVNDIPIGFESIDPEGAVYLGAGRLANIPDLEVLINGVADRVEFVLSGIDPEEADRLDIEEWSQAIRGAAMHVGFTTLDDYYQPMSKIIPLWTGTGSFIVESMPAVKGHETPTVTLALSASSGKATRSRNTQILWSGAQQRAMHPGDAFCDGTARLARGVAPAWPRY